MEKLAIFGGTPAISAQPAWPVVEQNDLDAVRDAVLSGGWYRGFGDRNETFERAFAEYTGAQYAMTVTNGTAALEVILACAGIGPGDEVIVPAYTFYSTASAVAILGATPVFCDVDMDSYNLDCAHAETLVGERTRAIIPVHFGGLPADMGAVNALAKKYNLFVLEDCSHAHGSPVGTLGNASSWSFQASKNLTSGEGGAVLTNDKDLYDRMFSRHTCGRRPEGAWYGHYVTATNLRLSEIQAALLLSQLSRLEKQTQERMEAAAVLDRAVDEIPFITRVQHSEPGARRAYHLYMFRYSEAKTGVSREKFIEALCAEGVTASVGYPIPLYKQPVYRHMAPPAGQYPYYMLHLDNVETLCRETVMITQPHLLGGAPAGEALASALRKVASQIDALK